MASNHYETLRVKPDATTDQVRRAYHQLAKEHHPDRFSEPVAKRRAEEIFSAMTEAFNVLTNATRRQEYDAKLREDSSGESQAQKEAKGYFRAGTVKLGEGNAKDAIRLFKAAIHLDPTPASYYAHYARALEADAALGEASRQWEEAVKREPYNGKYYRMAGECLERAGMKIRAKKMYELALKWDKGDAAAAEALKRLGTDEGKSGIRGLFKRT